MAPRWSITGALEFWAQEDVGLWLAARTFTDFCGISRQGKQAWNFRAWPPSGLSPDQGITFDSGMVVAPATWQNTRKGKVSPSRDLLGAPNLSQKPRSLLREPLKPAKPSHAVGGLFLWLAPTLKNVERLAKRPSLRPPRPTRLISNRVGLRRSLSRRTRRWMAPSTRP